MKIQKPTADQIARARQFAGLTQKQAADLVYASSVSHWSNWETGKAGMSRATWHLFLILTGQTDRLEKTA
jgi:DNA-binding transcriptional regulator YiaG